MGGAVSTVLSPITAGLDAVSGVFGASGIDDAIRGTPSSSEEQSSSTSFLLDNLFSQAQGQEFGNLAAGLAQQGLDPGILSQLQNATNQGFNNPYASALQNQILNPQVGALSPSQQAIVDQAMSMRQAQFNNLGIGSSPAAQTAIAGAAASPLAQFALQNTQNLMGASALSDQTALQQQQQQIGSLLGQLGLSQENTSQGANTLLNLAGLGAPQVGQQAQATGTATGDQEGTLQAVSGIIGLGG